MLSMALLNGKIGAGSAVYYHRASTSNNADSDVRYYRAWAGTLYHGDGLQRGRPAAATEVRSSGH